jgi:hypothetical protein
LILTVDPDSVPLEAKMTTKKGSKNEELSCWPEELSGKLNRYIRRKIRTRTGGAFYFFRKIHFFLAVT